MNQKMVGSKIDILVTMRWFTEQPYFNNAVIGTRKENIQKGMKTILLLLQSLLNVSAV